MKLEFTERTKLADYEWELSEKFIGRCPISRDELKALSERSNLHGVLRVGLYTGALLASAWSVMALSRISIWLALPAIYFYWFLYGFWVAIAHELQHKMVFAKSLNWLSELIYFFVQVIIWNSPRYARISHQLHHRYTMVRGVDPETKWPDVTTKWLRTVLLQGNLMCILGIGAIRNLYGIVRLQIARVAGAKDKMMEEHCSEKDIRVIRIETAGILLCHLAVVVCAIWFHHLELLLFVTIAWQFGWAMESLWHNTEHIGRIRNMNDQRLVTRSVKVGFFVHLLYGGLDDHVDHHLFPSVPSRNLPKLHRLLHKQLPEPRSMINCWKEIFAIAKEKDICSENEYVSVDLSVLKTDA
jgi:fatty acid desaturase